MLERRRRLEAHQGRGCGGGRRAGARAMGGTPEQGAAAEGSLVARRRLGQWRLEVGEAGWRGAAAPGGRGSGHGGAGR